jgi:hypothetical protein
MFNKIVGLGLIRELGPGIELYTLENIYDPEDHFFSINYMMSMPMILQFGSNRFITAVQRQQFMSVI